MLARAFGSVLCVAALGTIGLMSAAAADTKAPEIKDGIPGKIVKVDVEQATVTVAGEDGRERTYNITEETVIVGPDAVIDSIGVVSLIVDIEQRLEMDHEVSVTLANDRAMSQRNSPFRTAAVLADHILATEREGSAS